MRRNDKKIAVHLRLLAGALSLFLLSSTLTSTVVAETFIPKMEYQIKASLVFNFLSFVTWPETTAQPDLRICNIGPDIYGKALAVLRGEILLGKRLTVSYHPSWTPELSVQCEVALFTEHTREAVKAALATIETPILTIGESDNFLEDGGIIRFVPSNNSVGFEINLARAQQNNLGISTKLIRLAKRVIAPS